MQAVQAAVGHGQIKVLWLFPWPFRCFFSAPSESIKIQKYKSFPLLLEFLSTADFKRPNGMMRALKPFQIWDLTACYDTRSMIAPSAPCTSVIPEFYLHCTHDDMTTTHAVLDMLKIIKNCSCVSCSVEGIPLNTSSSRVADRWDNMYTIIQVESALHRQQ